MSDLPGIFNMHKWEKKPGYPEISAEMNGNDDSAQLISVMPEGIEVQKRQMDGKHTVTISGYEQLRTLASLGCTFPGCHGVRTAQRQ